MSLLVSNQLVTAKMISNAFKIPYPSGSKSITKYITLTVANHPTDKNNNPIGYRFGCFTNSGGIVSSGTVTLIPGVTYTYSPPSGFETNRLALSTPINFGVGTGSVVSSTKQDAIILESGDQFRVPDGMPYCRFITATLNNQSSGQLSGHVLSYKSDDSLEKKYLTKSGFMLSYGTNLFNSVDKTLNYICGGEISLFKPSSDTDLIITPGPGTSFSNNYLTCSFTKGATNTIRHVLISPVNGSHLTELTLRKSASGASVPATGLSVTRGGGVVCDISSSLTTGWSGWLDAKVECIDGSELTTSLGIKISVAQ